MRHFRSIDDDRGPRLFAVPPQPFDRRAEPPVLAAALGATLYSPATRPRLADDLIRLGTDGLLSAVACLEDAIPDDRVEEAQHNVVRQLRTLSAEVGPGDERLPLTFIRVRRAEQITAITAALGDAADVLSGFVLPKFDAASGPAFLEALHAARTSSGQPLLAMPVVETAGVIHRESRTQELLGIRALLEAHRAMVLSVRIGATDLAAFYGLRRGPDVTVWDVRIVADVVADIVNVLGRADGSGWLVSGTVWEHFPGRDRLLKPQLRRSPFDEHDAGPVRQHLVLRDLDGLLREVLLDHANGLTGKTVIHPSHVAAVHALSAVTHEEFSDASDLVGDGMARGGAASSRYSNKMNEGKPHRSWAERTLRRASAFGVLSEDAGSVDLLRESVVAG